MPPYQGSVSWVRYRLPSRLESGASQLQTTPTAASALRRGHLRAPRQPAPRKYSNQHTMQIGANESWRDMQQ